MGENDHDFFPSQLGVGKKVGIRKEKGEKKCVPLPPQEVMFYLWVHFNTTNIY